MSLRSRLRRLIPEVRTDKNGVMSVRWVRPEEDATQPSKSLPAPALPATPVQAAKPSEEQPAKRPWVLEMTSRLREATTPVEADRVRDLLFRMSGVSEDERTTLNEVLDVLASDDDSPDAVYERRVTGLLLDAIVKNDYSPDDVLYALKVRKAFCSERSQQGARKDVRLHHLMPYVKGTPMTSVDTPEKLAQSVAAVRFSYELGNHFRYSKREYKLAPTFDQTMKGDQTYPSHIGKVYKDADLMLLVMEKADQVDELIDLYAEHLITDVRTLRMRLENPETPLSLIEGAL